MARGGGKPKGTVSIKWSAFYDTPIGKQIYMKVKDIVMRDHPEIYKEYRIEYLKWYREYTKKNGKIGKGLKKKQKIFFNLILPPPPQFRDETYFGDGVYID
jgi:hypothetical protein